MKIMKIIASTIPHAEQPYETVGMWQFDPDATLRVESSDLGDWRFEACVQVHEIVEALICKRNLVAQAAVDEFDIEYERQRKPGDLSEPGDDPRAPYYAAHQVATAVERLLARELGVNWREYDARCQALHKEAT